MKVKQPGLLVFVLITGISLTTACSVKATPTALSSPTNPTPKVTLVQTQVDNKIPKKLYACLPKQVQKLKLLAHSNTNNSIYYLVGIYQLPQHFNGTEPPPEYQETLVELDNIGCSVVISKEKKGAVSLTQYVSEKVARELSLQTYKQAIEEAGGKDKFQHLILEDENQAGYISYYFPEDVWALQQLGIRLPANIQIVEDVEQLKTN
jgi:hypothetical protein